MCVGSLAGVTYLRYTELTRSKKAETAVHCCDPALSVLVVSVSRNVFHVVSALAPEMYITKENKWQLSCCCHDSSHAANPVLITTKIPISHLTQGSSTPNNLMGRVKTKWAPCLFRGRPPVPLKKVANGDIWFFTERDWSQGCCHGNNIVGVILFLL